MQGKLGRFLHYMFRINFYVHLYLMKLFSLSLSSSEGAFKVTSGLLLVAKIHKSTSRKHLHSIKTIQLASKNKKNKTRNHAEKLYHRNTTNSFLDF